MQVRHQHQTGDTRYVVERRFAPRYTLEVPICIYPRQGPVLRGTTVDISEGGIAVMLRDDLELGELVRLEFTLMHGPIEIYAVVRQRNAFRFGFQFLERSSQHEIIRRTCRDLAVEQGAPAPKPL